jgi:hypothetical protein
VVFVGSVVRSNYPWNMVLPDRSENRPGQVDKILNYVATEDWVVAVLAKAFQTLDALFDIGSAGYDGFDEHKRQMRHPDLHEAKFIGSAQATARGELRLARTAGRVDDFRCLVHRLARGDRMGGLAPSALLRRRLSLRHAVLA